MKYLSPSLYVWIWKESHIFWLSFGYLEIERVTNERKTWFFSEWSHCLWHWTPQPSDPVVFLNKDSYLGNKSPCPWGMFNVLRKINRLQFKFCLLTEFDLKEVILWTLVSAGTHNPQIPVASATKVVFLACISCSLSVRWELCSTPPTPGLWLMEQPSSNYRTLLITVGEKESSGELHASN